MRWKKVLLIMPPVLIGVAVFVLAPRMQVAPRQIEVVERPVSVRTLQIRPLAVQPRATGYGVTGPARSWEAVAEVAGHVVWVSDELKKGRIVRAGDALLRIDDSHYRLAVAQINAQLDASEARDRATRASLAIAGRDFKLLRDDLQRKRDLAARGSVTQTTVEAAERQLIASESQLQGLQNTLDLNAAERQMLVVQRAVADLDLARTQVSAPFEVRLTEVRIGEAQYANKGQLLFSADGLDAVEIEARFPVGVLRPLMTAVVRGADESAEAALLELSAKVRLSTATHVVAWPARIDRTGGVVDPQTQSMGVVVVIDQPMDSARPGLRPPLFRNTFVEVELIAPAMQGQIVIPVAALRGDQVLIVDENRRVARREVGLAFASGGYAVIRSGLSAGEYIVISDLPSVMEGMLLDPHEDGRAAMRLAAEAAGTGVLQ